MVDFINEVEEELRKDKYNELLRKFGPYILAVTVAIVAIAGFLEWKKSDADQKARASSAAYVSASDLESDGNLEGALRQFMAISEKAPAGYSGLSLMRAASIRLEFGESAEAVKIFDKAAETFEHKRHSDLARMKAAYILADLGQYDEVITRMEPLAKKDTPYEFLARELLGFSAEQKGDLPRARQEFSYLSTIPGVPDPIKDRADQALSLMQTTALAMSQAAEAPSLDESASDMDAGQAESNADESSDAANKDTANDE